MTNPWNPGSDVDPADMYLPWLGYSQTVLWLCGAVYVLFGVGFGIGYPFLLMADPTLEPEAALIVGGTVGFVTFVICAGFGAVNFVAAVGLGRRARWAWVLTIVIGAIYISSICLPFGAVLLYGMLNADTRKGLRV